MDIEVNLHGVNRKIEYHILPDEEMRKIGFHKNYYEGTDHEQHSPYWYFAREINFPTEKYKNLELSFIVRLPKDGSDIDITIIDWDFCQPYDYQYLLAVNPKDDLSNIVRDQVEYWMQFLQDNGVISGHVYGEYI